MIGVIAHVSKPGAPDFIRQVTKALHAARADFLLEKKTAAALQQKDGVSVAALAERCRVLLVLGGDGTILRVLHQIPERIPPIFGLNIGSLGFLTCLGPEEAEAAVASVVTGNFATSPRRLLRATLCQDGKTRDLEGLNDLVLSRGERSQLVKVRVLIDGQTLTEYYADGLIVATPTGSTAYSLSAGGPILMPDSGSHVITPICPHVLTNRSVVVGDDSVIRLEPCGSARESVFLAVDGHNSCPLGPHDWVEVRKSERILPLATLPGRSFSEVLGQKLKWSGSNV
jgi:NAD+ kinase